MSKHPYGANSEMLLLLAWLSTHDLAGLVRKDRETRPWKRPPSWDSSQYPSFPEGLLREQVETALGCFHHDPIYGTVLEALARERLTYINFALLSWAIELQNLTNAHAAFHISNDAYYARREQKSEVVDETDVFWRVACAHTPLADRLKCLSTTWHGEICGGASELRIFFIRYLDKIQQLLHVPFFLVEYVRISLLKIDWHRIAENLLDVPHLARENCRCTAGAQETVTTTYVEQVAVSLDEIGASEGNSLGEKHPSYAYQLFTDYRAIVVPLMPEGAMMACFSGEEVAENVIKNMQRSYGNAGISLQSSVAWKILFELRHAKYQRGIPSLTTRDIHHVLKGEVKPWDLSNSLQVMGTALCELVEKGLIESVPGLGEHFRLVEILREEQKDARSSDTL